MTLQEFHVGLQVYRTLANGQTLRGEVVTVCEGAECSAVVRFGPVLMRVCATDASEFQPAFQRTCADASDGTPGPLVVIAHD
jgi:hypothetical protein